MGKLLLLAVAIWLIIVILKRYRASMQRTSRPGDAELMVQCHTCGLHLPSSDSLLVDDRHYCCKAHAEQRGDER